jgi:hypothetical protein
MVKNAVFDRVPGLLRRGPIASKRVALTFDDGPDELTPNYLEVLDDLGVPATFFVSGENVVKHPSSSASTCGAAIRSRITATITPASPSFRASS